MIEYGTASIQPNMDINSTVHESVAVIRLQGRFDFPSHRQFHEEFKRILENSAIRNIQIDLGGLEYLDSAALGMILLARENAQNAGKAISLTRAAGAVRTVLDNANFQQSFTFD